MPIEENGLFVLPYDPGRAVAYARRWALGRNPLFVDFAGFGGDCTNFVSQCVLAGACVTNPTPDFGWYYLSSADRAPAWAGVRFFYEFMTCAPEFAAVNGGVGPFGEEVERRYLRVGDAVQLANGEGTFYHTLIVTGFAYGEVLVAAHSIDSLDRPLSSYEYASLRYLHIAGVRSRTENRPDCYAALLAGEACPVCGGGV